MCSWATWVLNKTGRGRSGAPSHKRLHEMVLVPLWADRPVRLELAEVRPEFILPAVHAAGPLLLPQQVGLCLARLHLLVGYSAHRQTLGIKDTASCLWQMPFTDHNRGSSASRALKNLQAGKCDGLRVVRGSIGTCQLHGLLTYRTQLDSCH